MIVSKPWREELRVGDLREMAQRALARLSPPPPEEEGLVLDVSASRARTPSTDELCEAMLRRTLRQRNLMVPLDGSETGPGAEAELEALDMLASYEATATPSAASYGATVTPSAPSSAGPGRGAGCGAAAAAGSGEEPAMKRPRTGAGEESTEATGETAIVEAEESVLTSDEIKKLRMGRIRTASATLASRFRSSSTAEEFVVANRQGLFCVYHNCVMGNPHLRWVERVAARCGAPATGEPEGQAACPLDGSAAGLSVGQAVAAAGVPEEASARLEHGEVILTVAVCNSLGHKDQEFDILASQHLYELRDAMYFASDWMFDGPTRIKSACFFIDGIFYSDMRDPTAIDYSPEIIEFMKQSNMGERLRRDSSVAMDVRLCDLDRIPLGERCVYIHQGDIEHSVYFTNARLASAEHDCPFVEAYPLLTFMRRHVKRRCYVCCQNFAIHIVLDSHRCPHNPSFWCGPCFRHFHQDPDGNFLCPVDYKVFPYLHDDV